MRACGPDALELETSGARSSAGKPVLDSRYIADLRGALGWGAMTRRTLLRSCPPSACGLLLLNFAEKSPPTHRARAWRGARQHSLGNESRFYMGSGIDGPSRPRRCPRPALLQDTGFDANVRASPQAFLVMIDEARRVPRRAARRCAARRRQGQAPKRQRRCGSSVTTRSAGTSMRRSRQARRPVSRPAAGLDAASMARRGHTLNMNWHRLPQRMLNAGTPCSGQDGSADSSQRSKGGGGRRPTGDMSGEESAEPSCPIPARPAQARHDTEAIASSAAFPHIGDEPRKSTAPSAS